MRAIELCFVVMILIVLTLVMCGCQEERQVWGQGELPIDYRGLFGDSNIARLNFVQTNTLNQQGQTIAELVERLRKLEEPEYIDPNVPTLESRVERLERAKKPLSECPFGLSKEKCEEAPLHSHTRTE